MKNKGVIMKPDPTKGLELYVDADFAGEWSRDTSADPRLCLSQTGYVLMYAGCPVLWKSQLQTIIALSTAEAEYLVLSFALRTSIPLIRLLKEIGNNMPGTIATRTSIHCKVYEDNQSTIRMAQSQTRTFRTKHIGTKVHHYRQ